MNGHHNHLPGEITKAEGNLSKQLAGLSGQMAALAKDTAEQNRAIVLWMAGFALTLYATVISGFIIT